MSLFSSIHSFLLSPIPRPENRSREQIERDLEDEFAFHLEMKARALMADDGLAREAASGAAHEKFGDVEAVKSQCRRIALKERVMLQRVNFVMMAVVMVMVIAVGVQMLITQRYNTLALQAITAEMTNMKYDALAAQRGSGGGQGLVYLDGEVARPGQYALPITGTLTLRRAITAAGGANQHDVVKVVVRSDDGAGNSIVRYTADRFALTGDDQSDFILAPNDHVTVTGIGEAAGVPSSTNVARVLMEGDVPGTGWHEIDMERGTFVNDLLAKVGARDDQWVAHGGVTKPVAEFKMERAGSLLRPGTEYQVSDEGRVPVSKRKGYYENQWRNQGLGAWHEIDDAGQPVSGGWRLQQSEVEFPPTRSPGGPLPSGVLTRADASPSELSIVFNMGDAVVFVGNFAAGVFEVPWTVEHGRLVLDFAGMTRGQGTSYVPPELPLSPEQRKRVILQRQDLQNDAAPDDARAKAVGDFVLQLFAAADPNDPNLGQTIRDTLDQAERELDVKYKDDPATAGMIRELIAARRKIFEHDAALQQAATAEAKTKAVTDFLNSMLASVDPHAQNTVTVREVLDNAAQGIDERFADNPEVAAALRQRIADAMKQMPANAGDADAANGDEPLAPRPRDDDDEYPKLSPFRAVRWKDYTPFVDINGTWGELVSIDGVPAAEIVDVCRTRYRAKDRKRFSEDLVQALMQMGQRPGAAVKVEIKEWRTGAMMSIEQAPMTEENRRRVYDANIAAGDGEEGGPGYPVWSGEPPDALKDAGANAGAARPPPMVEPAAALAPVILTPQQIEQDLAALASAMRERFSYLHLRGVELEPLLQEIRDRFAAPQGAKTEEFSLALQRMLARFGDGHAGVSGFSDLAPRIFAPFLMRDAGGRIVALRPDRSAFLDPDHPYLRSINGMPIERLIEVAGVYVADGSPALKRRRSLSLVQCLGLVGPAAGADFSQQVSVELASEDGASTRTMTVGAPLPEPNYASQPERTSRVLEGNIGYLRLSRMDRDDTRLALWMMPQLRDTQGLIIDVRSNGGGSRDALLGLLPYFLAPDSPPQVVNIAAYRLSEAFEDDHLAARYMFRRDDARWSDAERRAIDEAAAKFKPEWTPPQDEFSDWHYLVISRDGGEFAGQQRVNELYSYDKPVIVLMDGGCFSATDIFLGAFKGRSNITLMGTASSGGSGRKQSVRLPASGLVVSLSSMVSYLPGGRMYDLTGIEPDMVVQPIATDFIVDRTGESASDSQLDAALTKLRRPQ